MPPTATRLDWLSFTVEVNPFLTERSEARSIHSLMEGVNRELGGVLVLQTPNVSDGRYPYKLMTEGVGFRAFWTMGQAEVLIEVEGAGCEALEASGKMRGLVERVLDRLTRVDLATDIQTDTTPQDFVAQRTNKRQKSHQTSVSSTGTTCYIGSRKSDRYVRVYRYAEPHPRSDRLRVESVYRGPQAVALARTWLEAGNDETAARAGNQYGWTHPDWTPKSEAKITAWRPDRKNHNQLHWYKTQCKPSIRRMVAEGHLAPDELITDLLPLPESQIRAILTALTSASASGAE